MRPNPFYSLFGVVARVAIIAMIFAAMYISGGALFATVVPVVFFVLLKGDPSKVFFWILVTVCALASNSYIAPKGMVFAIAQRGMLMILGGIMTLRFFSIPITPLVKPFMPLLIYLGFMIIPSINGWDPEVSYLKLILFSSVYIAYLGVVNMIAHGRNANVRNIRMVILAVAVVFILGSVALVPFPAISQLRREDYVEGMTSLFCGMTMHSQSLGPIISSISVVLFSDLLFSIRRFNSLYVLLLLFCPYLIYLTSSRTGMGAYLLGMFYVFYLFSRARGISSNWKSKIITCGFVLSFVLLTMSLFVGSMGRQIQKFALKGASSEISTGAVISSRQGLIDRALDNFKRKPYFGNGFQVGENMEGRVHKSWKSLLSAPIEKGVWITAILEEGGIIGWGLFVCFLVGAIVGTARRRAYISSACLFTFTLTNLGEFTFFSMSYTGGFAWAMIFAGLALDVARLKEERIFQVQYYGRMPLA